MTENIKLKFTVPGDDFTRAGEASSYVKQSLKQLGVNPDIVRKIAIAMYEGEINMVIHANGGNIDVEITPDAVLMKLQDHGPGISDIEQAMQEGFSTAPQHARNMGFGAGMGLPNMRKNSDEMEIESTPGLGTTIFMKVYMPQ